MSCYKELVCEIEALREQLHETVLAVQTLRDIAVENGDSVRTAEILLQLSGVPKTFRGLHPSAPNPAIIEHVLVTQW